jgi:ribosome-binding factor A
MSNRTIRVNELVQRELSNILRQRYQSEAVAITISEVRVSPDLRDARVFVAVVGDDEMAEAKLKWIRSKAGDIREEISKRIVLKYLPKFEYLLDRSAPGAARIGHLLDELGHRPGEESEEGREGEEGEWKAKDKEARE